MSPVGTPGSLLKSACSTMTPATTSAGTDGAPTLAGQVRERLGREQVVAVVGEERVHRTVGDQMAAPGGRVQLVIGCMACWAHPGRLPAPSSLDQRDRPVFIGALARCARADRG